MDHVGVPVGQVEVRAGPGIARRAQEGQLRHEVVGDDIHIAVGRQEIDLVLTPRATREPLSRRTDALNAPAAPDSPDAVDDCADHSTIRP
ncbi:hypothetical protein GCM10022243_14720 [Saccharothrix violaceirubra]